VNTMTRYLLQSERQLQIAEAHGIDGGKAHDVILKTIHPDYQGTAGKVYAAWRGEANHEFSGLARFTGTFHVATLLSTAGIIQPAQLSNTAAKIGWGNTLRAMSHVAQNWRESKLMAGADGVLFDNLHNSLVPNTMGGLSEKWGDLIGLNTLDRFDRVVSAVGGKFWANEQAQKLKAGVLNEVERNRVVTQFQKMGIDPEKVMKLGLDDQDLRRAGLYTAQNTQFASSVLDLPANKAITPQGKFLYLFKSFAAQQTRFVKDEIVKPALEHRDYRPAFAFAMGSGVAMTAFPPLIRAIKNRDAPQDETARLLEDFGMVGGFGMFFDAFRAMAGGPNAIFPWVLGPTAGEAARVIGADLPPIVPGMVTPGGLDFGPVAKHVASRVPGAGPWLKNMVGPQ
jgi:hypothetical protein